MNPRHKTIYDMREAGGTWASIAEAFEISSTRVQEIYRQERDYLELIALHPIIGVLRGLGYWTTAGRVATFFKKEEALSAAALAALGGDYVLKQPRFGRTVVEQVAEALESMGLIQNQKLWIIS
jgi:hypothetical protein